MRMSPQTTTQTVKPTKYYERIYFYHQSVNSKSLRKLKVLKGSKKLCFNIISSAQGSRIIKYEYAWVVPKHSYSKGTGIPKWPTINIDLDDIWCRRRPRANFLSRIWRPGHKVISFGIKWVGIWNFILPLPILFRIKSPGVLDRTSILGGGQERTVTGVGSGSSYMKPISHNRIFEIPFEDVYCRYPMSYYYSDFVYHVLYGMKVNLEKPRVPFFLSTLETSHEHRPQQLSPFFKGSLKPTQHEVNDALSRCPLYTKKASGNGIIFLRQRYNEWRGNSWIPHSLCTSHGRREFLFFYVSSEQITGVKTIFWETSHLKALNFGGVVTILNYFEWENNFISIAECHEEKKPWDSRDQTLEFIHKIKSTPKILILFQLL